MTALSSSRSVVGDPDRTDYSHATSYATTDSSLEPTTGGGRHFAREHDTTGPCHKTDHLPPTDAGHNEAQHHALISFSSAGHDKAHYHIPIPPSAGHDKPQYHVPIPPSAGHDEAQHDTPILYPSAGHDKAQHDVLIPYPSAGHDKAQDHVPILYPRAGHDEAQDHAPILYPSAGHDKAQHHVPIPYPSADDSTPNVIIFGESGVGKSSLINMITGTDSAATSNEAVGCTFQSRPYDAELEGHKYRLWDTIGLNEGERGTASPEHSIQNLHKLVQNLQNGGVSLLVYCIRGSRIRDIIKINYDLFWKIICNQHVPIALVVTGLENEEDMENWWTNNSKDLAARGMEFDDHACVTTTKGKLMKSGEYMFETEFDISVQLVQKLIVKSCSKTSWKPDRSRWLIDIVQTMNQMFFQNEGQRRPNEYGERPSRREAGNGYLLPDLLRQFFQYIVMSLIMFRR